MKLALLTYFAASLACATAADADDVKVMPKLFGAGQLVDIEAHCEGCQPDYCYANKGTPPDFKCYKDGYPKCCTKDKGNCPNNKQPGCECDGPCNGGGPPERDERCFLGGNECGSDEYCKVPQGDCMLRIAEIEGRCTPIPEMCTSDMNEVCGCDGKTYSNACGAASNGVNVAMEGACHEPYRCVESNQGEEFPLCADNDHDEAAYCDGQGDCSNSNNFCNCQVGEDFCRTGVNPCEDEEPYTCVEGGQGQEYPLCDANKNNSGEYCDGQGDCGTSRCDCDVGEEFCDTRNNPCD